MAIELTISLTDQEQAYVAAVAAAVAPGATVPEIIEWAQAQCKDGLRKAVEDIAEQHAHQQGADARAAALSALPTWAD